MNLEQPCIRISVRNLVEFILRYGDIDNRTGGADKEAMQQGGRIHRKIQRQQGAEYRAEVSLKYQIACDGFILSVEGRADGIIELPKRVVIDEIKGVFKDLKRLKEPQLLHLAQAKCYAYIYAEQKNLEEIGVQMTYCNLDTEEIRRFQEVYTRAELKKWFEELVSEYEKWARYQMEWRAKRNASIKTVEFPFEYRDGQKKLVASVYRTILRKKEIIYSGTDRSRQDNGGRISGGESSRGRTGRKDLLSDGEDNHQNGGKSGIRDPEEAGSEDESHHIDGKRKDLFL